MVKKILKISGITLGVIVLVLAATPFLFKNKIKELVSKTINENVNAQVAFEDVGLNMFKSFPNASVSIDKLSIINKAPFEGDTLLYAGEVNLKMSVKELFKGEGEPMNIEGFSAKNSLVNIIFNKDGIGNFDIALKEEQKEEEQKGKPFALNIQKYGLENLQFRYIDEKSKIKMVIANLNHEGNGNFGDDKLDLTTKTTAKLSLDMDKMSYMKNVALTLDAVLGIDLKNQKYTFKDNKALINQLPLEFTGFIQMKEKGQLYDLKFKTPTSEFKNFLGLIPESYAGNINTVKTTGEFKVDGQVNGELTDTTIPKFNIEIASNNASFQYPDLPKSVQNIVIDTKIVNQTGLMNDTYVNLNKLSFRIDQDVFNAKANISNIAENALINANLNGVINLANVTKAYPVKLDKPLSGILKANVSTKFDMKSVETSQYQNIQNSGNITLTGFNYTGPEMAKPVQISQAVVAFNPNQIRLNQLDLTTGKSDLSVVGSLDNFYGFVFKNQILKGDFSLKSNQLLVSDFMVPSKEEAKENSKKSEALKIPAFLDCSISANANTVVYDNLNLKDVSGKLIIKDEAVILQNVKTSIFDGNIGVDGVVSTKEKVPTFKMNLGLDKVDIAKSFTQLDMLKAIAPIANAVSGKLNSKINISGNLDANEMTPDLKTISGDLVGQLLSASVKPENSQMLTALSSNVKFVDLKKLSLNDIKAALTFKNGRVNIKPIDLKYQDVKMTVSGEHGFDQSLLYDLKFDVPVKYLGNEVGSLLAKLTPAEQNKLENVPVNAKMTGNFSNPKITTDSKQVVANVTQQLVQYQKDKLVNQGSSMLGGLLGGTKATQSSTSTPKDTVKTQSAAPKNDIKSTATGVLNGLLGKKKKE